MSELSFDLRQSEYCQIDRIDTRGRELPPAISAWRWGAFQFSSRPYNHLHGCWRVRVTPLADRLNRKPPVWECSLITTPLSFLRYASEPPSMMVIPAVTAEYLPVRSAGAFRL
jgi:hypothetical protein